MDYACFSPRMQIYQIQQLSVAAGVNTGAAALISFHLPPSSLSSQCSEFEQWSEEAVLMVHNALGHNITYSLDLGATSGQPCLPVGGGSAQADVDCTIDCVALAREVGTYVVQVVFARIRAHTTALCVCSSLSHIHNNEMQLSQRVQNNVDLIFFRYMNLSSK
jgi:hypothetical protein